MALDRFDAIFAGANSEGLACALAMARAGRKVAVVERKSGIPDRSNEVPASTTPQLAASLGLFEAGLRLGSGAPSLVLGPQGVLAIWPDANETSRALETWSLRDASAYPAYVARLRRLAAAAHAPGAVERALLAATAIQLNAAWDVRELGSFWLNSIRAEMEEAFDLDALRGGLAFEALERLPISPDDPGSAPALLTQNAGSLLNIGARAIHGGECELLRALIRALKDAGAVLQFGEEVREIVVERDAAGGVSTGSGETLRAPIVVACMSPRRLAQGLLRPGRTAASLTRLPVDPGDGLAIVEFTLGGAPHLGGAPKALLLSGAAMRLGATMDRLLAARLAYARAALCANPCVSLRLSVAPDGRVTAIAASPFTPLALSEGPWTTERRDRLLNTIVSTVASEWPDFASRIESAQLIKPALREGALGIGVIQSAETKPAEPAHLLRMWEGSPEPAFKGVYLARPMALDPHCLAGAGLAQFLLSNQKAKDWT